MRKLRNIVPSLSSGCIALLSHKEAGVQVGVQGLERSLVTIRQCAELDEGGAARRVAARAATGSFTGALRLTASGVARLLGTACALACVLALISERWCGGDDSGQGNGSDERDDGFVEQHCKECGVKAAVAFLACV